VVNNITENGIGVIIPKYGLEGNVFFSEDDKTLNKKNQAENDITLDFFMKG